MSRSSAPRDDLQTGPMRTGLAYVHYRNQGSVGGWGIVKQLVASDPAAYDCFGRAVAVAGDVIAVGAHCKNMSTGAVYVFLRDQGGADSWGQIAKLTASDGQTYDRFGRALAIAGDVVAVGAPGYDERTFCVGAGCPSRPGSVYLFGRNTGGANAWGQVKRITGSTITADDQFGDAVALVGDRLFVGANREGATQVGAAFVFERALGGADNWGEATRITIANTPGGDELGTTLASDGTTLLVGAPRHDELGADAGAVLVFGRDTGGAGAWGLATTVLPPTAVAQGVRDGYFGKSIAADGDWLVVGAYDDYFLANRAGAAHVFRRSTTSPESWEPVAKLLPSSAATNQFAGWSVAISGGTIVVGAYGGGTGRAWTSRRAPRRTRRRSSARRSTPRPASS